MNTDTAWSSQPDNSRTAGNSNALPVAAVDNDKSIISQARGDVEGEGGGVAMPSSPEEYKFEFQPDTRVDEKLLGGFQQWAHKTGLPMDEARALVQMFESHMAQNQRQWLEQQAQQQLSWRESLLNDPEFMRNQDKNFADIRRGMNAYNSPELEKAFAATGLVDHPEFVKLFMRLGRELAEPTVLRGGGVENQELTNDQLMQQAGWKI